MLSSDARQMTVRQSRLANRESHSLKHPISTLYSYVLYTVFGTYSLNLGLGTYCGLPPVGWVHIILVLFLMVFIPVSTQATSDVGTK